MTLGDKIFNGVIIFAWTLVLLVSALVLSGAIR